MTGVVQVLPYPAVGIIGPDDTIVGYKTYSWTTSNQAFTLDSLTGGGSIEEGDLIILALTKSENTTARFPVNGNPGFHIPVSDGAGSSYQSHVMMMVALEDGPVSGTLAAAAAGSAATAVFYVVRGLHPRFINAGITSNVNPGSITLSELPTRIITAGCGRHANNSAAWSAFGDMSDGAAISLNGGSNGSLAGIARSASMASASPYDGAAWTPSQPLEYASTYPIAYKEDLPTSLEFGRYQVIASGGATNGSPPLRYDWTRAGLREGTVATSTAVQLQGANSMSFNGSQIIRLGGISGFGPHVFLGANDFTMEVAVRFSAVSEPRIIARNYDTAGEQMFAWLLNSGGLRFVWTHNGSTQQTLAYTWVPTVGVDYHLAVCRSGSDLRMFINGVNVANTTISGAIFTGRGTTALGQVVGGAGGFNGYMAEYAIYNGAKYPTTSSFTPPTTPFPRA